MKDKINILKGTREKLLKDIYKRRIEILSGNIDKDKTKLFERNSLADRKIKLALKEAIEETSSLYQNELNLLQEQIKAKDEEFDKILSELDISKIYNEFPYEMGSYEDELKVQEMIKHVITEIKQRRYPDNLKVARGHKKEESFLGGYLKTEEKEE